MMTGQKDEQELEKEINQNGHLFVDEMLWC